MKVTILGIDLAKNVFRLHGVDAEGRPVLRKQLRRAQLLPFMRQPSLEKSHPIPPTIKTGSATSPNPGIVPISPRRCAPAVRNIEPEARAKPPTITAAICLIRVSWPRICAISWAITPCISSRSS